MRALIIGSAGQAGRALLSTVPDNIQATGLARADLDLTDANQITRAVSQSQADVLINAAAYTAVDRAEEEEGLAFQVNAGAVDTLSKACSDCGTRLTHISTDFVFDGGSSQPYAPDGIPAPQSAYGRSKLAGEKAALASSDNLVVRTAWVYSAHGNNFVKTMLGLMAEKEELRVVTDQIGTPTHASSLARCIWALVEADARGVMHYTDAGVASWYDFAVAIQEEALAIGLLDRAIPVLAVSTKDYPTPAKRPAYSVLDKAETCKVIGRPARHWRVELREMLKSLKEENG